MQCVVSTPVGISVLAGGGKAFREWAALGSNQRPPACRLRGSVRVGSPEGAQTAWLCGIHPATASRRMTRCGLVLRAANAVMDGSSRTAR